MTVAAHQPSHIAAGAIASVTPEDFLAHHHESFGDPVEVMTAFNSADILLATGLHPAAFTTPTGHLEVPNMLLINNRRQGIGLKLVNCGYRGAGPGNTERLLAALDWPAGHIALVEDHRFLRLSRHAVLQRSAEPLSDLSLAGVRVAPDGTVTVQLGRPERLENVATRLLGTGSVDPARAWIANVLHRSPQLTWAQGRPVARCYRTAEAADGAGLRDRHDHGDLITVIIEQGQLQLWCPMPLPHPAGWGLPQETCDLLDAVGLPTRSVSRRSASPWWGPLVSALRLSAPYVDISAAGDLHLRRTPQGQNLKNAG